VDQRIIIAIGLSLFAFSLFLTSHLTPEALGGRGTEVLAGLAAEIGRATGDAGQAMLMAQAEMARVVARQSLTMAFNDVFRLMAWIFLAPPSHRAAVPHAQGSGSSLERSLRCGASRPRSRRLLTLTSCVASSTSS
jgi:hypothetical protein